MSVVCEQNAATCLLAGTLNCHRVVAIKMAPAVLCHEGGKLRNGLDLPSKPRLSILLSKLKAHVVRKRETYSKERLKEEENL